MQCVYNDCVNYYRGEFLEGAKREVRSFLRVALDTGLVTFF